MIDMDKATELYVRERALLLEDFWAGNLEESQYLHELHELDAWMHVMRRMIVSTYS